MIRCSWRTSVLRRVAPAAGGSRWHRGRAGRRRPRPAHADSGHGKVAADADDEEDAREDHGHADVVVAGLCRPVTLGVEGMRFGVESPRGVQPGLLVLRHVLRALRGVRIRERVGREPGAKRGLVAGPEPPLGEGLAEDVTAEVGVEPDAEVHRILSAHRRRVLEAAVRPRLDRRRIRQMDVGRALPLRRRVPRPGGGQRHDREQHRLDDQDHLVTTRVVVEARVPRVRADLLADLGRRERFRHRVRASPRPGVQDSSDRGDLPRPPACDHSSDRCRAGGGGPTVRRGWKIGATLVALACARRRPPPPP